MKALKAFGKIELGPGESKRVQFTLTEQDLMFYTINNRWEAEPGAFNVFVGTNSEDVLEAGFTLQ